MKKTFPILLIISLITAINAVSQIQWEENGIFTESSGRNYTHTKAVSDGNGGYLITYEDDPAGDIDIYAQWIDATGTKRWGSSGIVVCSEGLNQIYPAIAPDGSGGAYIAWEDEYSGNIYAQRINSSGSLLWSPRMTVCSAAEEQSLVEMVPDNSGGAILVWKDMRNGDADIYAQRITSSGTSVWDLDGVPITTAPNSQSAYVILGDGSNGVFVAWHDSRNGFTDHDIYAQRLTSAGNRAWTSNGIVIANAAENQRYPAVNLSGTNLVITWEDYRYGNGDIYVQAVDFTGNVLWTTNGVPLCQASNNQTNAQIVPDNSGGAIVTWTDNRSQYDIYAQRVNGSGTVLWTTDGIPVNTSTNYQYVPRMVKDGAGGAFIVWTDDRTSADINIYGQHIDASGTLLWANDGLAVAALDSVQENPTLLSDQSGGAIAIWEDSRDIEKSIFGQLLNDNLSLSHPEADALWAGNQSQTIEWTLRNPSVLFDHFRITASETPGDDFPIAIAQNVNPTQTSQSWTPSTVNSTDVRIKIQAENSSNQKICEYISEPCTIDSDPPYAFNLIEPQNNALVDVLFTFNWEPTTDNLSGLDHYELWINDAVLESDLQNPTHTLTAEQELEPGEYTWTVKAVDNAGLIRESGPWHFTVVIDTSGPEPFHLLSPANNLWTTQTTPVFTWEAAVDTGTGMFKYQFFLNDQLKIDNLPPTTTSVNTVLLTNGTHTWHIVAFDSAMNDTRSEEVRTLHVDNIPPEEFDITQPEDGIWLADTTPLFGWQATSDQGIGTLEYQLWIDGQLKIDHIPSSSSSVELPAGQSLNEGTHTWHIVALDGLGNSRASTSEFTIGIDVTAPLAFGLISPENPGYTTTASPDFSWQNSSDNISGLKAYQLWIDDALNRDNLSGNSTSPVSPLNEGQHAWFVRAIDNANNVRQSTTFTLTADWSMPLSFSLLSPADGETLHKNRPTFTWRSTEDAVSGFDKFQFFIGEELKQDNLSAQDTSVTLTETLENGNYYWKVVAWDNAGNDRVSDYNFFTIDCNPPEVTSSLSVSATEDAYFSYTATATDPDEDPLTITFHNYPSWLSPSGNVISGTPTEGITDTSFVIQVQDGVYTITETVFINVNAVDDPPTITSPSSVQATEHQEFTYTATALDPEGDSTVFQYEDYPDWLTPLNAEIFGTPPEGAASTEFTVIATANSLSDTLSVALTVIPVNDPPEITSQGLVVATEGYLFVYQAMARDPDSPQLTLRFIEYPSWLKVIGPEIYGKPGNTTQDTTFTIIASDNELCDTMQVTLQVVHVNDPPVFDFPLPELTFNYLDTLKFELALNDFVSDPDDPDSVLTWSYTPIGNSNILVSIKEKTHQATITACYITESFRVAFTVWDPSQASASDTVTVNIIQPSDVESIPIGAPPEEFTLHNNYPNPFNPSTAIRYGIPKTCHVTVRIFNILGQEVSEPLVDMQQKPGTYEVHWNAYEHPSGIYFYSIQAGDWHSVNRMLLLK